MIRCEVGMPVSRFARLAGIPRRTYCRRLARLRDGAPVKGPWPAPAADAMEALAAKYAVRRRDPLLRHVRTRVKSPQTNGVLERFFGTVEHLYRGRDPRR